MLVLKKVYSNKGTFSGNIIFDKEYLDAYVYNDTSRLTWSNSFESDSRLSNMRFDIYNTESGVLNKKLSIWDIYTKMDRIFGITVYCMNYIFVSITDIVWNFLDLIDEPKDIGQTERELGVDDYFSEFIEDCDRHCQYDRHYISNKAIYVFKQNLSMIDKNGVIWAKGSSEVITILDVYLNLVQFMNQSDFNKDKVELFLQKDSGYLLELTFNKRVLRYLTKLVTLRR